MIVNKNPKKCTSYIQGKSFFLNLENELKWPLLFDCLLQRCKVPHYQLEPQNFSKFLRKKKAFNFKFSQYTLVKFQNWFHNVTRSDSVLTIPHIQNSKVDSTGIDHLTPTLTNYPKS